MMTGILIGGLLAIALLLGLAFYATYRAGREDGYEQGYGDARQEKLTEDRRSRAERAGRHRAGQPRAWPSPAPAAVPSDPRPGPVTLPSGGAIGVFLARHKDAVTARDIDTVLLAPQASPSLTGVADTGTMTKVKLSTDPDTGEMRAVTDAWIAENIRPEAVL
jgi:hypothetical protein